MPSAGGAPPRPRWDGRTPTPPWSVPPHPRAPGGTPGWVGERGAPHPAGVRAGPPSDAAIRADTGAPADIDAGSDSAPVTARPLPDHTISSRNPAYPAQFHDTTKVGGLNDPAPRYAATGSSWNSELSRKKVKGSPGGVGDPFTRLTRGWRGA